MSIRLARRAVLTAVLFALTCVGQSTIGVAQHDDAPPGVLTVSVAARTRARRTLSSPWVSTRAREAVATLDAACCRAALAQRPTMAGELVVHASLAGSGRLSRVSTTRTRGGSLSSTLASCVRRTLGAVTLDTSPLPRPPEELEFGAQYVETDGRPPGAGELPVALEIRIRFTAPPVTPTPTPDPTPEPSPGPHVCRGANPEGCRSRGCPGGMRCDTHVGCVPSSCGCNTDTGAYVCTTDCGGGTCVPTR